VNRHAQTGFSLLEVIVAFVVFALVASVALSIASRALTGADRSARYQLAVMVAESLLDRAAVELPPPGTELRGEDPAGLPWTMRLEPVPGFDGPDILLLRVEAQVQLDPERSVLLETLILAPVPE